MSGDKCLWSITTRPVDPSIGIKWTVHVAAVSAEVAAVAAQRAYAERWASGDGRSEVPELVVVEMKLVEVARNVIIVDGDQ